MKGAAIAGAGETALTLNRCRPLTWRRWELRLRYMAPAAGVPSLAFAGLGGGAGLPAALLVAAGFLGMVGARRTGLCSAL